MQNHANFSLKLPICVILCGGKSSRMGQDKTLMEFGEFSDLTHFQFAKMSEIFKSVFISAKSQKFDPPLPVLTDEFSEFSPMGAVYSILKNFKDSKVFIIPCDMPFVEISTIYELYENVGNCDICVASDEFRQHNLCGFFDTSVATTALKFYKRKNHKIANLLNSVKCKAVKFANSEQFHNINDKFDYEKAVSLLKKEI
ncbi:MULTISPECIES: molybdenum cofactor guanylyltransferase [unclassified Campylobacter]|uniref:molybdenum cofactor guanylyltransferase n=1 Tax=unclassified Campylobacter TaxID=2593542 RepID=UPI0022E9FA92|nr:MULTISPECIES: molybdenum cofactor guanylyltransferase [unclassified Campylobacter]MDA3079371.1 molybdenum cofactor guanylyltransferase [Campylobacter sp. CS_NA2]MDA3081196.1 molybdenum cofactor guanylyltransferase [Campylobacter sp. CS_NA1]MDA3085747.1 molybdenum cofactor guanylyltransferase [Campylobacter sp. CS_ED1]MDA3090205.1 molybdenum cofactor guanylyltransferase [Campylobacter sp. CS_ED2]WBR51009.1 molybdenum cofactor guanylyltransferase [Campylobacter sp. CS_NA3]